MHRIKYPEPGIEGKAKIIKLVISAGHSAPLAKIIVKDKKGKNQIFYNLACVGAFEGQEINIGKTEEIKEGDIIKLQDVQTGAFVYNIEARPGDGGKFVRSGGGSAIVLKKVGGKTSLKLPSKKTIEFDNKCRVSLGIIAADGRLEKPLLKAGKRHHIMKSKGRKWHFTSAVKMNAIDHPFGGGRGKRIKSKIAKRNAPPGAKVGHIRPRQTGKKR